MAARRHINTLGMNRWPAVSALCHYLTMSSKGALAAFVGLQVGVTPWPWGSWVITCFPCPRDGPFSGVVLIDTLLLGSQSATCFFL
jgi:hypothetical protein